MKNGIKIVALLCVMVAFGSFVYKSYFKSSDEIILNGNVEIQDVDVSFRVTGRINDIMIEEGNTVKKGQTLATIDTDILEAQLKLANAKVIEADIKLSNYKKDFDRNKVLFKRKSVSEKIFDDIVVKYKTSIAEKDEAVASYDLAKIQLNDAKIKSPVDGVVLTRNIEIGEMITSGIPVFSIMPNAKTKIKTFVNEETLSKIKHNDIVYVNIETMPDKQFKGHIGFISSEAEFTPRNIETKELRTSLVYRVRVIIDEPAQELKQGMPVTVKYKNS